MYNVYICTYTYTQLSESTFDSSKKKKRNRLLSNLLPIYINLISTLEKKPSFCGIMWCGRWGAMYREPTYILNYLLLNIVLYIIINYIHFHETIILTDSVNLSSFWNYNIIHTCYYYIITVIRTLNMLVLCRLKYNTHIVDVVFITDEIIKWHDKRYFICQWSI